MKSVFNSSEDIPRFNKRRLKTLIERTDYDIAVAINQLKMMDYMFETLTKAPIVPSSDHSLYCSMAENESQLLSLKDNLK